MMSRRPTLPASLQLEHPVHIIASPYKTGSTSLEHALVRLGVGSRPMPHTHGAIADIRDTLRNMGPAVRDAKGAQDFLDRHGDMVRDRLRDFTATLTRYDIFADAPFGHAHIHPFIRRALAPRSRFIWINRNRKSWIRSVRAWETAHPEIYPDHAIWDTDPKARIAKLHQRWQNKQRAFRRFARAFPDDCLELHLETLTDFAPLCDFYGLPDPGCPFPKANAQSAP